METGRFLPVSMYCLNRPVVVIEAILVYVVDNIGLVGYSGGISHCVNGLWAGGLLGVVRLLDHCGCCSIRS